MKIKQKTIFRVIALFLGLGLSLGSFPVSAAKADTAQQGAGAGEVSKEEMTGGQPKMGETTEEEDSAEPLTVENTEENTEQGSETGETKVEAPAETEIPTNTEEPTQTEVPIETETPEETEIPTETNIIEETKAAQITEIDLGDYLKEMTVGERQLLVVTLLPLDAGEQKVTYSSSNTKIVTINGLGRIEALRAGSSTITVTAGEVSQSFVLKVKAKEDGMIHVTDIEIGNHESELEVGKTMTISGTVLPSNATKPTITFTSSNPSVATVSSSGEVKGISKGQVTITLSADGVSKSTSLTVKVPTTEIKLNSRYIVLKAGQEYSLTAVVIPKEAEQTLTYRSEDDTVAAVSETGIITAKGSGNTTIFVSNKDTIVAASVIVNESIAKIGQEDVQEPLPESSPVYDTVIYAAQQKIIDSDMLTYLYHEKKILKIIGEGYSIEIDGDDIVNYNNEIYTDIFLEDKPGEIGFTLNKGKELCGPIALSLEEAKGKYLYLYNSSKEKYELIDSGEDDYFKLTTEGEYRLYADKMTMDMEILQYLAAGIICLSIAGSTAYIFVKKKYWFW